MASLTLTENAITTVGTITTTTSTICSGEIPGVINGSAGAVGGARTYQWQSSLNGTDWSDIATTTGVFENYTPSSPLTQDTSFRRKTISTIGASVCEELSNVVQITISTPPTAVLKGYPSTPPAGEVLATASLTICAGASPEFYASGVGAVAYQFFAGGVSLGASSTVTSFTSSSLSNGENITVRTFNAAGCSSDSNPIEIVEQAVPAVQFASSLVDNVTFCSNTAITFTATGTGATNYEFKVGGVTRKNSADNFYLAPAGSISDANLVEVIVTGGGGCTATSSLTMVENAITTVGTITTTTSTICSGEIPGVINGSAGAVGGARTYQWQSSLNGTDWSDIATTTGVFENYTPSSPLTQDTSFRRKTISTIGASVCEELSNVVQITISTPPTAVLKGYPSTPPAGEVLATASLTICAGASPEFYASGVGAVAYQFFAGGVSLGASSTVTSFTSSSLSNGENITVRTFNAAGCSSDSNPIEIVEQAVPAVQFASSLVDNVTFCSNTAITFTATGTGATNYEFKVGGVTRKNSADNFYLAPAGSISDANLVEVIVTGGGGCTATSSLTMVENAITTVGTITTATSTICSGETPFPITGSVGAVKLGGALEYQWYRCLLYTSPSPRDS